MAARLEELRRRQARGLLTEEERAELEAIEARVVELEAQPARLAAERQRLQYEQKQWEVFCAGSLLDDDNNGEDRDRRAQRNRKAKASAYGMDGGAPPPFARQRRLRRVLGGQGGLGLGLPPRRQWVDAWMPVEDAKAGLAVLAILERRAQPGRQLAAARLAEAASARAQMAQMVALDARREMTRKMTNRKLFLPMTVVSATVQAAHATASKVRAERAVVAAMAEVARASNDPVPEQATAALFDALPPSARDVHLGTFCVSASPRVDEWAPTYRNSLVVAGPERAGAQSARRFQHRLPYTHAAPQDEASVTSKSISYRRPQPQPVRRAEKLTTPVGYLTSCSQPFARTTHASMRPLPPRLRPTSAALDTHD